MQLIFYGLVYVIMVVGVEHGECVLIFRVSMFGKTDSGDVESPNLLSDLCEYNK